MRRSECECGASASASNLPPGPAQPGTRDGHVPVNDRGQFTALRYFALDSTSNAGHEEQGSLIRRYIIWRNKHAADQGL